MDENAMSEMNRKFTQQASRGKLGKWRKQKLLMLFQWFEEMKARDHSQSTLITKTADHKF